MTVQPRTVAKTVAWASFDPGDVFGPDREAHVRDLVDRLCEDDVSTYVLDENKPHRLESVRVALDAVLVEFEVRRMIPPLHPSTTVSGAYVFSLRDDPGEDDSVRQVRARMRLHRQMLVCLRALDPAAFERLCGRLLDHIGCSAVHVTRSSKDLGADFFGRFPIAVAPAATAHVPALARVLASAHLLLFGQAKRYADYKTIDQDTVKLVKSTWDDIVARKTDGDLPEHLEIGLADVGFRAGDNPVWMFVTTSSYTAGALDVARSFQMQTLDGDQLAQLLLQDALAVVEQDGIWATDDQILAAFCA